MSCFNNYAKSAISRAVSQRSSLLSKVAEIAKRMTELEEHTQKLHADLRGEFTKVSRDIPNILTNLLSSALQG